MPKSARISSHLLPLLFYAATISLLLFSALNIEEYLSDKKVLGVEVSAEEKSSDEIIFWEGFLSKNPKYIPGWIELGRFDKVKEIDPNYIIP